MANYLLANLLFGRGNTASPFWEAAGDRRSPRSPWRAVTLPTARKLAIQADLEGPDRPAVAGDARAAGEQFDSATADADEVARQ